MPISSTFGFYHGSNLRIVTVPIRFTGNIVFLVTIPNISEILIHFIHFIKSDLWFIIYLSYFHIRWWDVISRIFFEITPFSSLAFFKSSKARRMVGRKYTIQRKTIKSLDTWWHNYNVSNCCDGSNVWK